MLHLQSFKPKTLGNRFRPTYVGQYLLNSIQLKVIHISSSISGGAGSAAVQLHKALLAVGVQSYLITLGDAHKTDAGQQIYFYNNHAASFWRRSLRWLLRQYHAYLSLLSTGKTRQHYIQSTRRLSSQLANRLWALPFSTYPIQDHPLLKEADVIHLHWCIHFVDLPDFFKAIRKPIVWTFHDSWGCRGLANIAFYEHNYSAALTSLDNSLLQLKKQCYALARHRLHLVAPSMFMKTIIGNSAITNDLAVSLIPNSVCLSAKKKEHNPQHRNRPMKLLFVSAHLSDPHKGFGILHQAATTLGDSVQLTAIGYPFEGIEEGPNLRLPGTKNDTKSLFQYYEEADVLIIPSLDDNLPNVMLEAFSIGMPVIAFPTGGLCEHIIEGKTGVLATDHTPEALIDAIEKFMATAHLYTPSNIISYWQKHFSPTVIASQHMHLYTSLVSAR